MTTKTKGAAKPAHPHKDDASLQQAFGDLPRIEGQTDLRLVLLQEDINDGEPGNRFACAIAKSCQRVFGSSNVVILRGVAYVDLLNDKGDRQVERFILGRAAKKVVRDYDVKGNAQPTGIVLKAPKASSTLANRKVYNDRRKLAGYKPTRSYTRRVDPLTLIGVRNGTGIWRIGPTT